MYIFQVTFLIDWRSANKYPALVIFYINSCFMVSCIGWLVQFTPGSRDVIICRKDGTLRTREPRYVSRIHSILMIIMLIWFHKIFLQRWKSILRRCFRLSILLTNGSCGMVRYTDVRLAHELSSTWHDTRPDRQKECLLSSNRLVHTTRFDGRDHGVRPNWRQQHDGNLFRGLRRSCAEDFCTRSRITWRANRRILFMQR